MARKLKKSEEVESEAAKINEKDTSVIVEVEAESGVGEAEAESVVAATDAANDYSNVRDYHAECGGVLRAQREAQNLSTQSIAKQLRLSSTQIEALEQNNFAVLPEPTIVKGFIRNYAKLLKIPAEPILAAYAELMPKTEQYAFALSPGINMKISENTKSSSARYLILTILLLLGLGAWFFYQNYIQKPDAVNPMPEMAEMFPEELALQVPTPTELSTQETTDESPTEATEDGVAVDAEQEPAADSAVRQETAVEPAQPESEANAVVAVGKTRLEFNATQETWLSVVNASGEEVYNKILYAGNRDVVDVVRPSEITVGNAHGATLVVDGKPIDLAPYTRINVARVRLSR